MELHCSGQKKHFGVHGVFPPGLHNREAAEGLPQLFCDLVRKQQLRYYRPDYNFTVFYLLSSELNIMNLSNTQPVCLSLLETLGWPLPLQPCYTRWFPQCAGKPCFLSPPAHPGPWPAPATWWGGGRYIFRLAPSPKNRMMAWAIMPVQSPFLFWTRWSLKTPILLLRGKWRVCSSEAAQGALWVCYVPMSPIRTPGASRRLRFLIHLATLNMCSRC